MYSMEYFYKYIKYVEIYIAIKVEFLLVEKECILPLK